MIQMVTTSIRIPQEIHDQIKALALSENRSVNRQIETLLDFALQAQLQAKQLFAASQTAAQYVQASRSSRAALLIGE
jgi:hypothetical protein